MNQIHASLPTLSVLPLVRAIVREIRERRAVLRMLESALDLTGKTAEARSERRRLCAECSIHRRELRRAHGELERLGCMLLSLDPPAVAISSLDQEHPGCVIWHA